MKNWGPRLLIVVLLLVPNVTFALCSASGITVVYVNGVLTNLADAQDDLFDLQTRFVKAGGSRDVIFRNGYNPSHLGGGGDLLQSIAQAFGTSLSDHDLKLILMQIAPQVTTRKILLLGHSQGTFYTNEMYDYLTTHGVPKESIAVYNVATPASYVAGGGGYLTSSNDKVVNMIRDKEIAGDLDIHLNSYYVLDGNAVSSALRANVTLPKESGWAEDSHGGHYFGNVYLTEAGDRIVSDIDTELGALKASGSSEGACFEPPTEDLAYQAWSVGFAMADPLASSALAVNASIGAGIGTLASGTYNALTWVVQNVTRLAVDGTSQVAATSIPSSAQTSVQSPPTQVAPTPSSLDTRPVSVVSHVVSAIPDTSVVPAISDVAVPGPAGVQADPVAPVAQPSVAPPLSPFTLVGTPGFGGGGGSTFAPTVAQGAAAIIASQPVVPVVSLQIAAPESNATLATSSVAIAGTTDANNIVTLAIGSRVATTTADGTGAWSFMASFPEGDSTFEIFASNSAGDVSRTDSRALTVDLTPPSSPVATIAECDASLVSWGCVVATSTITVRWADVPDTNSYAVAVGGAILSATGTSTRVSIGTNGTTTLEVVAYDAAGNAATSSALEVAAISQSLILNEVGWAGYGSSAVGTLDDNAQWIEIRNLSPYTLDLSHVVIARSAGAKIVLSGTISGTTQKRGVYVVIARSVPSAKGLTQGGTFGSFSQIVPFDPLSTTTAERLSLIWKGAGADTVLDATPAVDACVGWCAGAYHDKLGRNVTGVSDLYAHRSMERIDGTFDGSQPTSWRTTDSYGRYVYNEGGDGEWGTPGSANSIGLPEAGIYCTSGLLLDSNASPGPEVNPTGNCFYLARFITGNAYGATRYGSLYRGDVGNSTQLALRTLTVGLAGADPDMPPKDAQAGEHFFYAIWENRGYAGDAANFDTFLSKGGKPPHGNYAVFPFVYRP